MRHYRWADLTEEQMNPSTRRRFVTADRVTLGRFELKAGGAVPAHAHENEQVTCVISGALKFRFKDGEVLVRAGEVLQIPSWAEHAVDVVEDTIAIDVFCPVRQDWIDRTDSYFKQA